MMAGAGRFAELLDAGLSWGSGEHHLRLGHVKIMLTMSTGALHPSLEELRIVATKACQYGFPVAVHCVEQEAVAAAAQVLSELPPLPSGVPAHRIEHCSECPPEVLAVVRVSCAAVVTQPGFIHWNGPNYLQNVAKSLQPHLYPIGSIETAAVPLAFGSDAPMINPNPWPAIHSAVTRRDHQGQLFPETNYSGRVTAESALRMYTLSGAESEGTAWGKGSISPGKLADMVLVDADPLAIDPEGLKDIKAKITIIRGKVVWEGR
jgi:predicted amidohydrolase YtcJ